MSFSIISPQPTIETFLSRDRWHSLRATLRWAYSANIPPRSGTDCIHVPHISAWLVEGGTAEVRTKQGQWRAKVGEWLIFPPGERWQQTSADCRLLSICFNWQWIFGRELFPLEEGVNLMGKAHPKLRSAGLRLAETVEQHFPGARFNLPRLGGAIDSHLSLQSDFTLWLIEFSNAMIQRGIRPSLMVLDSRLEEAVQILDRPGKNLPTPKQLSGELGISQVQLNRLFLRHLGTTVHGYCERQRLTSARMLLARSELSVKETAFRLGFISSQHFSRWFRKHSGLSPTQLRKKNANIF